MAHDDLYPPFGAASKRWPGWLMMTQIRLICAAGVVVGTVEDGDCCRYLFSHEG